MTTPTLLSRIAPLAVLAGLVLPTTVSAQSSPSSTPATRNYTVAENVVYGNHDGMALVMDVITPKKPNRVGVIMFVSCGYRSGRDQLPLFQEASKPFLDRGYTVFAVMHGSQPRYTVPEIVADAHRAVRFVRYYAEKYGIDPERLGATGASAGGQLALMVGCAGGPGDPEARDPIDRVSSKVEAVACFFPPTDFVSLEKEKACPKTLAAAFDFRELDPETGKYERVSENRRREIAQQVSPLTHAGKTASPTRIVHGSEDELVSIKQSEVMVSKLKEVGVESELVVKPGKRHYWLGIERDIPILVDWFDKHLAPKQ